MDTTTLQLPVPTRILPSKATLVCSFTSVPIYCVLADLHLILAVRYYSIYCSLLLLGVFTSTCYWNLAPATDSLLTSLASSGTSSTSIPAFISACWCDFNGGALLQPRKILYSAVNTTSTTNGAIALRTLPFESSALDSLPPIRWLSRAIESASKGFTENLLGVKLSL
jgi:hypothetical protein